jgi:hypothetical protein
METVVLLCVAYFLGAVYIGVPIGRKSIEIWKKNYPSGSSGGFWGIVLFPMTATDGKVGSICDSTFGIGECFGCMGNFGNRDAIRNYLALNAIFWLPRLLLNSIILIVVAALSVLGFMIWLLIDGFPRLFAKTIKL